LTGANLTGANLKTAQVGEGRLKTAILTGAMLPWDLTEEVS